MFGCPSGVGSTWNWSETWLIAQRLRESAEANGWVAPSEEPTWHRTKLKRGQLVGNRFEIIVSQCEVPPEEAMRRAEAIAMLLRAQGGWPNYYGPQRFGHGGTTAFRGRRLLYDRLRMTPPWEVLEATADTGADDVAPPSKRQKRKRRAPWLDALYLSALQSALFNAWLAARVEQGLVHTLCCGDLVCVPDSAARPRIVKPPPPAMVAPDQRATTTEQEAQPAGDYEGTDHGGADRGYNSLGSAGHNGQREGVEREAIAEAADAKAEAADEKAEGADVAAATSKVTGATGEVTGAAEAIAAADRASAAAAAATEGNAGAPPISAAAAAWAEAADWDAAPSAEDIASFESAQLTFTGPMYGGGMARTFGRPAELESATWAAHMPGLEWATLRPSVLGGTRRAGRLPLPSDLHFEPHDATGGLRFCFSLPAGAYATTLLREFVHAEVEQAARVAGASSDGGAAEEDLEAEALTGE